MPISLKQPITLILAHGELATLPDHPPIGSLVVSTDTHQIFLGTLEGRRELTDAKELAHLLCTGVRVQI